MSSNNTNNTIYSRPPPAGESPRLSLHQHLVLWLAVAVVKTTPVGTLVSGTAEPLVLGISLFPRNSSMSSSLIFSTAYFVILTDHLRRVRQERGLLKSNATSLDSTQLELSFPNSDYTLTPGNQDIYLDLLSEPIAFSPHRPLSSNDNSNVHPGGQENQVLEDRLLGLQKELDILRSQLATPCQENTKNMRRGADASDKALSETRAERGQHAACQSVSTQTSTLDERESIIHQADEPRSLDVLCQDSYSTQAAGVINSTQDMSGMDTSIQDATTITTIMEIALEATRMILSPLLDLRSVQKAYQQTITRLVDHMAAHRLTLQQLTQISGAFETSWMRLLQSPSAYDQDCDATSDVGSIMKEYLLVRPLSSPIQVAQMKHQTHLLFSQLLATLKAILQQLETRGSTISREMDVEVPRASQSTRLSSKAKAPTRQQRVRRALEDRHRQWRSDQKLGWLITLAMPLDRDCVRNMRMVQSQSIQDNNYSDLDEVTRRSEDSCRELIIQISSFATNSPPDSPDRLCQSPLPSWCRDLLVRMISSSDLTRGQR